MRKVYAIGALSVKKKGRKSQLDRQEGIGYHKTNDRIVIRS